ncbi:hypothetical protein AB833_07775 [Chromatiales bacterium (ex Bugula neritina AB1)]|nr:hypothetical protein AB833_07775 [Chromatiales bacterium (ex Bugula neritina AB1)]
MNIRSVLLTVALLICTACSTEHHIKPFSTDGCSVFPDGTFSHKTLWLQCCSEHDLAYWQGGTYEQRLDADQQLRACVAQTGEDRISQLMLAGVRVGGTPYLPTSFRWGYGWPYLRGYRELTTAEALQVSEKQP